MADPVFSLSNMQESTDWNVDPKTQTVAGQLNSVIATDSPIMQQARSRAMQSMNGRGLTNSSMATGAADAAVYDTALKIATPDAMTFADAAKTNAGTKNQFSLQNNQITGTTNAQNWGATQDFGRQTARDATQQSYTQSNMNLSQANDLAKMDKSQGFNLQTMNAQQGFDLTKMDRSAALTLQQMSAQQQNEVAKMAQAQGYNMQTLTAQQVNDLAKMSTAQANTQTNLATQQAGDMAKLSAQSGYDLAKMDKQTAAALNVADIEATYKNITQGSAAATSILNKMQDALSALNNPDNTMTADVRDQAVADIKTNAMESLNMIGALATDIDLSKYITTVGL